jgi:ribonuclease D
VQIAARDGRAWLVDPLAIVDLSPLIPVLAGPSPLVILHAGDNDVAQLRRRGPFTLGAVFDTALAARFLGVRTLGLDALLRMWLGIELPPSRQKDDWSARPLSPEQERYAVADVVHLFALKDRLVEALRRVGRLGWVEEECAALAREAPPERAPDPDAYLRIRGAHALPPRGLAILRALWTTRDRLARDLDRPPFKIVGDSTLLAIALAAPGDPAALAHVPGVTPRILARWGHALWEAVESALVLPEAALPTWPTPPRVPAPSPAARRRMERLRAWRAAAAPRVGLDPGVLLPNRLIRPIAEANPPDREALARVDGVRRWRAEAFGDEILAALRGRSENRADGR